LELDFLCKEINLRINQKGFILMDVTDIILLFLLDEMNRVSELKVNVITVVRFTLQSYAFEKKDERVFLDDEAIYSFFEAEVVCEDVVIILRSHWEIWRITNMEKVSLCSENNILTTWFQFKSHDLRVTDHNRNHFSQKSSSSDITETSSQMETWS
jgi:hypothetical protein